MTTWRQGVYQFLHQGKPAGTETWRIDSTPNRYTVHLEIVRERPAARTEQATIQLTRDWRPLTFSIQATTARGLRTYHAQRSGNSWISQLIGEDGGFQSSVLPFTDEMLLDYHTPLAVTIAIRRLDLQPDESRHVHVLAIRYPVFLPLISPWQYQRLPDAVASPLGGLLTEHVYQRFDVDAGRSFTFWADEEGVVLRSEGLFELILA